MMMFEEKLAKQTFERKRSRRVYRLPKFTAAQRAAYYGLPYIPPVESEEEEESEVNKDVNMCQSESSIESYTISKSALDAFIPPGKTPTATYSEEEEEMAMTGNGEKYSTQNRSSVGSYTISKSALDAFIPPGKTPTITDNEDEKMDKESGEQSQKSLAESSIRSYTISKSALNAFIPPGKTPTITDNEEEDITLTENGEKYSTQNTLTQDRSSVGSYTISKSALDAFIPPGKTPTYEEEEPSTPNFVDDNQSQKSSAHYRSKSSIGSYTISQSALDAFIPPGKTPTITDNEESIAAGNSEKYSTQNTLIQDRSSIGSFTISKSALDAFIPPGKTPTITDNEDESMDDENGKQYESQKSFAESSIRSYTISKSALNAFIPPGNTPMISDDDEEEDSESMCDKENMVQGETPKRSLKDSTIEYMEVDEYPTPKAASYRRPSLSTTSREPVVYGSRFASSMNEPTNFASSFQPLKSRMSLLLPHFMQPTTSSFNRSSIKPVSCTSPRCVNKPSVPMQSQQTAPVNVSSLQPKIHRTPRKTIAGVRKVLDQSFNAPKLPVLNLSNFEDIPKAVDTVNKESQLLETSERNIQSSILVTPKKNVSFESDNSKKQNYVKPLNLLQQYASPGTPGARRSRTPVSVQSHASVLKDRATSSPVKIDESLNEVDFGKVSFNEEYNETPKRNVISPITIDRDFDNMSINDEENVTPRRSIRTNEIAPITVDYDFDNISFNDHENPQDSINFDNSTYSVNTPGKFRRPSQFPTKPLGPLNFNEFSEESNVNEQTVYDSVLSNESLIKITAAVNKQDDGVKYFLAKPKLIKPESPSIEQPELRRSQRNRVRRLRSDLGERPVYNIDSNGFSTLVDVASVEVKDPRAKKFLTVDKGEQIKREKKLKNQQKMRKEFAKNQREL